MRSPITDRLLSAILGAYPLANPRIIAPFEASKRNDSFLVEDVAGIRYVLRRYRRNIDEKRIRFQLLFQQELCRRGFPTADVLKATSGNIVVTSEAKPWALFSHIEGSEYDFNRMTQVAEAARWLAEFHVVSDFIDIEEVVIDTNPLFRRWWTHGEEQLAELEDMFSGQGVERENAFLRDWHSELLGRFALERLDALPVGWVHGDYHGRNVVFVGDRLRGLFDFDVVHRGTRVEDTAHALFMFTREFRGSNRIRTEAARLFLDEYARRRPLRGEERAALPTMVVLDWAPSPPYYLMLQRDGEDAVAFFRRHTGMMRDLVYQMDRLGVALAEA